MSFNLNSKIEKQQIIKNNYKNNKILSESSDDDDSGCAIDELYSWVPLKTKKELIYSSNKIKQLKYQLPLQDFHKNFCLNIKNEKELNELKEFIFKRKKNYFGKGIPKEIIEGKIYCRQCKSQIETKTLTITANTHFGPYAHWHPNCFVCVECKELLVDFIYFAHQDNIFCGRHHAELSRPRCAYCDELIFGEECTEAEGKIWHLNHFCCVKCNQPLAGCQYVIREKYPFCLSCCQILNNYCSTCFIEIPSNQPFIVVKNEKLFIKWHTNSNCFCCSICKKTLIGLPYLLINGQLFCKENCENKNNLKSPSLFSYNNSSISSYFSLSSSKSESPFNESFIKNSSKNAKTINQFNWKQKQKFLPPPLPINGPPPIPPPPSSIQSDFKRSTSSENFYETVAPSMPNIKKEFKFKEIFGTNKSTKSEFSNNEIFGSSICSSKNKLNFVESINYLSPRNSIKSNISDEQYLSTEKIKIIPRKTFSKRRSKSVDGGYRNKKYLNNQNYCYTTSQINNIISKDVPTTSSPQKNSSFCSSESEITDNEGNRNNSMSSESDIDDGEYLSANTRFLRHYFAITRSESRIKKNNSNKFIAVNNLSVLTKNGKDESKKNISNCRIS